MLIIGSHVSFGNNQLLGSVEEAISYGANTFMFYTGAPQNTIRKDIDLDIVDKAFKLMKDNDIDIDNVVCHAPYIVNLANKKDLDKWQFSINFLKQELKRCDVMKVKYMVLHPGNAVGIDEIATLVDGINNKKRIGVCLDTCHLNDAGYDVNKIDDYLDEFDKKIGLKYIKCVHVNDSKNEVGSHKDRHENIGRGTIGFDNLLGVIYNNRLDSIPKILETPYIGENDDSKERLYPPYKYEIMMLKNREFDKDFMNKIRNEYGK